MRFSTITLLGACALLSTSCVSSKVFKELEGKYHEALSENKRLEEENQNLQIAKTELGAKNDRLDTDLNTAKASLDRLQKELEAGKRYNEQLKESYDLMLADNSSMQAQNAKKSRALMDELAQKEAELQLREQKVAELQRLINQKEEALNALKNSLKDALVGFEGKGLSVVQKNGKVYVSMENKLLFRSGSYNVDTKGKTAIKEIAKVLAANPEINVLIEGHTDDVPYRGSGQLKDNWDLSVKRATSIVKLMLKDSGMDAKRITAAGRSQYLPLVPNDNASNKAKNRRIEVILTPDLSSIEKMLQ